MRVLIVEDEPDLARVADITLTLAGFDVVVYRSADAALADPHLFVGVDVALVDLMVPGEHDGHAVRDAAVAAGVPAVAFTAVPRHASGDWSAVVGKPFTPEGLVTVVREVAGE